MYFLPIYVIPNLDLLVSLCCPCSLLFSLLQQRQPTKQLKACRQCMAAGTRGGCCQKTERKTASKLLSPFLSVQTPACEQRRPYSGQFFFRQPFLGTALRAPPRKDFHADPESCQADVKMNSHSHTPCQPDIQTLQSHSIPPGSQSLIFMSGYRPGPLNNPTLLQNPKSLLRPEAVSLSELL